VEVAERKLGKQRVSQGGKAMPSTLRGAFKNRRKKWTTKEKRNCSRASPKVGAIWRPHMAIEIFRQKRWKNSKYFQAISSCSKCCFEKGEKRGGKSPTRAPLHRKKIKKKKGEMLGPTNQGKKGKVKGGWGVGLRELGGEQETGGKARGKEGKEGSTATLKSLRKAEEGKKKKRACVENDGKQGHRESRGVRIGRAKNLIEAPKKERKKTEGEAEAFSRHREEFRKKELTAATSQPSTTDPRPQPPD